MSKSDSATTWARSARAEEFREGHEQMDRQEEQIAHEGEIITPANLHKNCTTAAIHAKFGNSLPTGNSPKFSGFVPIFRSIFSATSCDVRPTPYVRLMTIAPPELQQEISRVLKAIADATGVKPGQTRGFTQLEAIVRRMKGLNELNDAAIIKAAKSRRFDGSHHRAGNSD